MDAEPDEYDLALRAQGGEREALAELAERTRLHLFALAYAELGHYEDAQDVVAAALLHICRHITQLRAPGSIRPWMRSIVRNEVRQLRRGRQLPVTCREGEEPAGDANVSLLRLDIERALRRLPADPARALGLFYFAGLSVGEIARRVGRSEGTVKSWLHRGRRRLAWEMKEGYAPMSGQARPWVASIISTDFEPVFLQKMVDAMRAAGWDTVHALGDYEAVGRLEESGGEFHLPAPLRESRYVVLDDRIAERSALELYALLNATAERKEMAFCLLLQATHTPVDQIAIRSAYVSGFDMLLCKPFDLGEFGKFARHIRQSLEVG